MEQLNISKLIGDISPLYNEYKKNSRDIRGVDALCIMWDIGEHLKKFIESSGIAPHNLYRKIYGKSEGADNIVQNSYITREFLGRSFRIRNIFPKKEDIKQDFSNLKSFILFRESMPFFDNKKYILEGEERLDLLKLLNSDQNATVLLNKIRALQSEKIGRKNSRNQKLNELEGEKQVFISFYNYIFNTIKNNNYQNLESDISNLKSTSLAQLSSLTSCLAQEGLKFTDIPQDKFNGLWISYVNLLKKLTEQKDPKERRRFRRLIPPARIVKMAEMLLALSSESHFKSFKNI